MSAIGPSATSLDVRCLVASLIGRLESSTSDNPPPHVDVARGLALLFGIGTKAFHHGVRRRGGTASKDKTARIWDVHFATMSTQGLVDEVCKRRLHGFTTLSRDEMRLAGYPDDMLEIDLCAGVK